MEHTAGRNIWGCYPEPIQGKPRAIKLSKTVLFADDTTLHATGSSKKALFDNIKKDLILLIDWFRANKLSLNISKTYFVLFRPKHIKLEDSSSTDNYKLTFGTETIEGKPYVKFLGVFLDENLTWIKQCNHTLSKLSSAIYILNNVKNFLPTAESKVIILWLLPCIFKLWNITLGNKCLYLLH